MQYGVMATERLTFPFTGGAAILTEWPRSVPNYVGFVPPQVALWRSC